MTGALAAVDAALAEVERLRRSLRKSNQRQVRSADERALIKATTLAWFNSHRQYVADLLSGDALSAVDAMYTAALEASARHATRANYLASLGDLKSELVALRTTCISANPSAGSVTPDHAPDFSPLIPDAAMQQILVHRWEECVRCLTARASLAATVMMGGLLEALLLARINRERDMRPVFTARAAPKDKSGNPKQLSDWTLQHYIGVLFELKWITVSARDVGAVLRDYRNYVHPYKQLSHGTHLTSDDAALFWEISKMITRQIIASVP
jgi:hypothetical protein